MLSLQKATLFSPKHHTGLLEGSLCHRKSSLLRFVDQRKRSSFYFLAGKKESKMASRKDKESCFEIRGGGKDKIGHGQHPKSRISGVCTVHLPVLNLHQECTFLLNLQSTKSHSRNTCFPKHPLAWLRRDSPLLTAVKSVLCEWRWGGFARLSNNRFPCFKKPSWNQDIMEKEMG